MREINGQSIKWRSFGLLWSLSLNWDHFRIIFQANLLTRFFLIKVYKSIFTSKWCKFSLQYELDFFDPGAEMKNILPWDFSLFLKFVLIMNACWGEFIGIARWWNENYIWFWGLRLTFVAWKLKFWCLKVKILIIEKLGFKIYKLSL